MKRIYQLLAPALLLVACAEEDFTQRQNNGEAMELRAEINQEYTTRASDGGFANKDEIGVFIVNYADGQPQTLQPTGNHADNVRFTFDESTGKWTGSYQLYWKDKLTPVDAYGYYPFDAELDNTQAYPFSVQRNQRDAMATGRKLSGYEQSDFLWAKNAGAMPTSAAITLLHKHLMAGVKVVLTEGEGFLDGEWETIVKQVMVENTILDATINLQKGSVSCAGNAGTIIPQQQGDQYRAVVVPQTVKAGSSLFSLTIDGKSYQFTRQEDMIYYPSKLHNFTFDVQKTLETGDYIFSLVSESVTPWENDPTSHDGAAREYITVHVDEGEYIGDVITRMGIDPKEIVNLKLTGCFAPSKENNEWGGPLHDAPSNYDYIWSNMPYLESLNMKDLRSKDVFHNTEYYDASDAPNADGSHLKGYLRLSNGNNGYFYLPEQDDWVLGPTGGVDSWKEHTMYYLQHIVWPDNMVGIYGAFTCTDLRGSLIFPEGLKYLATAFGGMDGFYDAQSSSLSGELYIPSTIQYISDGLFSGGNGGDTHFTNELVLPDRMMYLGGCAFTGCTFMTGQIHIPEGITVLNTPFAPNMTAKVVKIPQGVTKVNGIGGQPSSVIFPEGVTEIGGFKGVSSLQGDIKLPSTLRKLYGTAFEGTRISHINLPEGLEFILEYTFYHCEYLQDTITIPSTVVQIQHEAFDGCKMLEAVILPEGLEEIQSSAFRNCRSLYYVRCLGSTPPLLAASAFDGVEKNECVLVVPEGAVDAYRNAENWREFKRITTYKNFVCRPMSAKLLNNSNTRTIVLNADGPWTVTHCPDWLHPSKTNGNQKTEMTVKIDAMAHGSENRRDSIVFTLTDKVDEDGNPVTCYYSVAQFDYDNDEDEQIQLQKATKGNRGGINVVFVGDGYDAEDIASGRYLNDVREGMEYFFAVEPYLTYKDYFNVYADIAMSYESGVCSNVNIWRQTKFGTTYGAGDGGRLAIQADEVMQYVMQDVSGTAVTQDNVGQTLVICVPNSDAYEGICAMYDNGTAVAFCPHSRWDYPNDYRGIIQHEAGGHGFGKLGDEYIYHRDNIWKCRCACCGHADALAATKAMGWFRNLSLNGRYKEIEWTHLIFDSRYGDIVDIYEGGYMHGQGIFRSEVNSCMNNNVPYYSTISRQAIVERILDYAGEKFDFETFVSKDSRKMGDKFLTRSTESGSGGAMHSSGVIVKKGSPMDYFKNKRKK